MSDKDDDDVPDDPFAALLAEMNAHQHPFKIVLNPSAAFQIAGLLQLALRHPEARKAAGFSGVEVAAARLFIERFRAYLADAPEMSALLAQGDDPDFEEQFRIMMRVMKDEDER